MKTMKVMILLALIRAGERIAAWAEARLPLHVAAVRAARGDALTRLAALFGIERETDEALRARCLRAIQRPPREYVQPPWVDREVN